MGNTRYCRRAASPAQSFTMVIRTWKRWPPTTAQKASSFSIATKISDTPELKGFVQAQNMKERLLQLKKAREKLGTMITWIADTIKDSMQTALKSGPNSLFLISPDGEIVAGSDRIDGNNIREVLAERVGSV